MTTAPIPAPSASTRSLIADSDLAVRQAARVSMTGGPAIGTCTPADAVEAGRLAIFEWIADYVELTKPRIVAMVLLTVTVGFVLGSGAAIGGRWHLAPLWSALAGVSLVAAGSAALNQLIERRTDARMGRTANRPLPAGRLQPGEVAAFGLSCGALGLALLAMAVNLTTALLAALTLVLYVAVYTPLKRYTALSTAVGAIPGALPPVLGWAAAGADLNWSAFSLFAIVYLWQFPHFLAIAWLYRRDYAAAGLRMLPGVRFGGDCSSGAAPAKGITGLMSTAYAAALIPVSLLPAQFALAGGPYRTAALLLGLGYLAAAIRFLGSESRQAARGLLFSSLLYLPILLTVLTWDHLRLVS